MNESKTPAMGEKIIVVAMTPEGVIGKAGTLPWHLPEDLRLFRELTWGHTLVMGRRTFESIGRALPGRRNIVISSTLPETEGIEVCRSFAQALELAAQGSGRIFFIGGARVYAEALKIADLLIISRVAQNHPGDTRFPLFDLGDWTLSKAIPYPGFTQEAYLRKGSNARQT